MMIVYESIRTAILFVIVMILTVVPEAFPFTIEINGDLLRHRSSAFCFFVIVT